MSPCARPHGYPSSYGASDFFPVYAVRGRWHHRARPAGNSPAVTDSTRCVFSPKAAPHAGCIPTSWKGPGEVVASPGPWRPPSGPYERREEPAN